MIKSVIAGMLASTVLCSASAEEVRIGFVNGLTGPIAETAQDLVKVTGAYIDMINSQGGVNGNKLVLVAKDDGYVPAKTAPLIEEIVQKDKVVAIVNSAGTAPTLSVIQSGVLSKHHLPLVGVFTGAEALRGPGSAEVFHTRPTYQQEIRKISNMASTLGLQRVAVLYQDDAFGQGILQSIDASEKEFKLKVISKVAYKAGAKDFAPEAKLIEAAKPQAIFLMGVPDSAYRFMKAYSAPVGAAQIYALSFVTPKMLASAAGEEKIRGIGITQVVPNPNSATTVLVKDFQSLVNNAFGKNVSPSSVTLEGYLNIRLLVEAIRMAGPHPTSEKVLQSLASMQDYRVGGFPIDFGKGNRSGSSFLDIAVVGRNARLQY